MRVPGIIGFVLSVHLSASFASAGVIRGHVRAQGPDIGVSSAGNRAYQGRRYKFAERIDYSRLHDFVIYIDQAITNSPASDPVPAKWSVIQRDVTFSPHVLPVPVGSTVMWPN